MVVQIVLKMHYDVIGKVIKKKVFLTLHDFFYLSTDQAGTRLKRSVKSLVTKVQELIFRFLPKNKRMKILLDFFQKKMYFGKKSKTDFCTLVFSVLILSRFRFLEFSLTISPFLS